MFRERLTPEALASTPIRSPAVPNHDGTLALFRQETTSFGPDGSCRRSAEVRVMDVATGISRSLTKNPRAHDAVWLGDGISNFVIYLQDVTADNVNDDNEYETNNTNTRAREGYTRVLAKDADDALCGDKAGWEVGWVAAPVGNLKLCALNDGCSVAFAVTGLTTEDGRLYNQHSKETEARGRGRRPRVRIYDSYQIGTSTCPLATPKHSIWHSVLRRSSSIFGSPSSPSSAKSNQSESPDTWQLIGPLHNALSGTELFLEPAPIVSFFSSSFSGPHQNDSCLSTQFSISPRGIVLVASDPGHRGDPTLLGLTDPYLITLSSSSQGWERPSGLGPRRLALADTEGGRGMCTNPKFSPDGSVVAFLRYRGECGGNLEDGDVFINRFESQASVGVLGVGREREKRMKGRRGEGEFETGGTGIGRWDFSPRDFAFSASGLALYISADSCGGIGLYRLDLVGGVGVDEENEEEQGVGRKGGSFTISREIGERGPVALLGIEAGGGGSSVYGFHPLKGSYTERVLVSTSSFVESWIYTVLDAEVAAAVAAVAGGSQQLLQEMNASAACTVTISSSGLSSASSPSDQAECSAITKPRLWRRQVSEMYFEGAGSTTQDGQHDEYVCHAWVLRPRECCHNDESADDVGVARSDTRSDIRWPVAVWVHGGPVDAWNSCWNDSTWNPAVWAEQGYVVVMPNITGSLGFGKSFASAARNNWGRRPYLDLVNCMDHLQYMPGIDTNNAVLVGASGFGGYMANWVQGKPLGRRFKTIVSQDAIFDLATWAIETDLFPPTSSTSSADQSLAPFSWTTNPNTARPSINSNNSNSHIHRTSSSSDDSVEDTFTPRTSWSSSSASTNTNNTSFPPSPFNSPPPYTAQRPTIDHIRRSSASVRSSTSRQRNSSNLSFNPNASSSSFLERHNPARAENLRCWATPGLFIVSSDNNGRRRESPSSLSSQHRFPGSQTVAAYHVLKARGVASRLVYFEEAEGVQKIMTRIRHIKDIRVAGIGEHKHYNEDEMFEDERAENTLEWYRVVFEWIGRFTQPTRRNVRI